VFTLETYPNRVDKVQHLLEPALVDFLNNTDFHYSSNSIGKGSLGWIDWKAIYPWILEVLEAANQLAGLSPSLAINEDTYTTVIRRFDKEVGGFINNCPRTENILPFAKFVVALLFLEQQEEIRKKQERQRQMRELLETDGEQDGSPRISAMWDTEDDLELHVCLPDDFGEINCRQQCVDGDADVNVNDKEEKGQTTSICPLDNVCWTVFDPQAVGESAPLCPPIGEYRVWLQMAARRSTAPCFWACQVTVDGQPQAFSGVWSDGDGDTVEITTFAFSEPK